jgi:hypothetical protein
MKKAILWSMVCIFVGVFHVSAQKLQESSRTRIGGWPNCAVVQDDYAYVAQSDFLAVVDISGKMMQKMGGISLGQEPAALIAHDHYLFAFYGWSDSSLQVIDIADPLKPVPLKKYDLASSWRLSVTKNGSKLYHTSKDTVTVIDLGDPSNLTFPFQKHEDDATTAIGKDKVLLVGNNRALKVYSISDPENPTVLSKIELGKATTMAMHDNLVVVGSGNAANLGVATIDLSDPVNPKNLSFVETFFMQDGGKVYKTPEHLRLFDDKIYTTCQGSVSLFIIDATDPASLSVTSKVELETDRWAGPASIDVLPPHAYVGVSGDPISLNRFDISDPKNPVLTDSYGEPKAVRHLATQDDLLYVAGDNRLWIYQIVDEQHYMLLGSDPKWYRFNRIVAADDFLYAIRHDTLFALDVSNPEKISLAGKMPSGRGDFKVIKNNKNRLYLISWQNEQSALHIIDISDPKNLKPLGDTKFSAQGRALDVNAGDDKLFMAFTEDGTNNLCKILEVSDPQDVKELGEAVLKAMPISMTAHDSLLYVASNDDSENWYLESFSIEKSNPSPASHRKGTGMIWQVSVQNDLVFISVQGEMTPEPEIDSPLGWALAGKLIPQMRGKNSTPATKGMSYDEPGNIFVLAGSSLGLLYSFPALATVFHSFLLFTALGMILLVGLMGSGETHYLEYYGSLGILLLFLLLGGTSAVTTPELSVPKEMALQQNYPNPFNPETTIEFSVQKAGPVKLVVYDLLGHEVKTLIDENRQPGHYKINFQAFDLASGLYIYQLETDNHREQKRMMLLK